MSSSDLLAAAAAFGAAMLFYIAWNLEKLVARLGDIAGLLRQIRNLLEK